MKQSAPQIRNALRRGSMRMRSRRDTYDAA